MSLPWDGFEKMKYENVNNYSKRQYIEYKVNAHTS